MAGRYLYLSPETSTRRSRLSARSVYDAQAPGLPFGAGLRVLPDELKTAIVLFYSLLDERQRRLYAGLEAMKAGHGGDARIAELVGMDPGTVARGRRELPAGDVEGGAGAPRRRRSALGKKNARGHRCDPRTDEARHRRGPDDRRQVDQTHD